MAPEKKRRKWPIILLVIVAIFVIKLIVDGQNEPYSPPSFSQTVSYEFSQNGTSYTESENSFVFSSPEQSAESSMESTPSEEESVVESDIPAEWRGHLYLDSKHQGPCDELVGDVLITFVFVNDTQSTWTDSEKADAQSVLMSEMQDLLAEAENNDVELSLYYLYEDATVYSVAGHEDDDWKDIAVIDLGYTSLYDAQTSLAKNNNATSAPIIFVLDKDGRPFATSGNAESVVLYSSDLSSFRHELFHLYGAKDFYYPKAVKEAAKTYLTDSVMNDGDVTDDFTAYTIGWAEDISANATAFLRATKDITQEYLDSEREKNQMTGYGTAEFDYGIYEGDLVFGVCHGQGTLSYFNGDKYSGGFSNGQFDGYGEYTWASGDALKGTFQNGEATGQFQYYGVGGERYVGGYKDWNRHGYGEYSWANGDTIKGNFVDGSPSGQCTFYGSNGDVYIGNYKDWSRNGYGEYTWANGVTYKGNYVDGSANGKGRMTWTDGSYYDGEYKDGSRNGNGTYVWADGSYFTGTWVNGNKHGYGVMHYADGTTREGTWDNDTFVG